jgi:hypothetical protein
VNHQVPQQFPIWLYWAGVLLGGLWFVRVEGRAAIAARAVPGWLRVKVLTNRRLETVAPPRERAVPAATDSLTGQPPDATAEAVISDYAAARKRLDSLLAEAADIGGRLERLGHGLSRHPSRVIVGVSGGGVGDSGEWEIVASRAVPTIGALAALTDDIRAEGRQVSELRERLILLGRLDVVQLPDAFFH